MVIEGPFFILVSGPPGVGKSTLARSLASDLKFAHLDKDCIDEPFSPGDRGEMYTRNIEPKVLESLLNLSKLNLSNKMSVILDVPWTHILLNSPEIIKKIENIVSEYQPIFAVIELTLSEALLKTRISKRGLDRDQVKLSESGWEKFKQTDRINEMNPIAHFLIDAENSKGEIFQLAKKYLMELSRRRALFF